MGSQLPLGTRNFAEKNGYHYDCIVRVKSDMKVDIDNKNSASDIGTMLAHY